MEMAKKKTVAMKKCADSATGKLGVGERLAYGYGDTACNIVFGMISTLLTRSAKTSGVCSATGISGLC